jgi:hypothetical protein
MASIISFSVYELFTFLSFFFSIASLIILTYILVRKRKIIQIAKKQSIQKSQIKSSQNEIKLQEILQKKDRELKELKLGLLKFKEVETFFLRELASFEKSGDTDYAALLMRLKNQVALGYNDLKTDELKEVNPKKEVENVNFSATLRKKHPFLTDQEIGLCNYFRLNMPSKEIASIEGITDGTVRVYKNKIKNKIGLSQMDSLNEYLVNIQIKKTA